MDKLFVTDKIISSWEANRTEPNLELIVTLSNILDCSCSYLIYGNDFKNDMETEIKLTETDFKKLTNILKKEATFLQESKQIDTYYQPTYRHFIDQEVINE